VGLDPDQSLSLGVVEAVQEVAFVLDQVSVTDWPKVTVLDDAEIVTVGCGFVPVTEAEKEAVPPAPVHASV
jgi:hypothetical protein